MTWELERFTASVNLSKSLKNLGEGRKIQSLEDKKRFVSFTDKRRRLR